MKLFILITLLFFSFVGYTQERLYDKIFFANSRMPGSYFYSEVAYSGSSWVKNVKNKLPVNDSLSFTPGNSLELMYVSSDQGSWMASLVFQPLRGMDYFSPATRLVMRMRAVDSMSVPNLPMVALVQKKDSTPHFISLQNFVKAPAVNEWLTIEIPLDSFNTTAENAHRLIFKQGNTSKVAHHLLFDQIELLAGSSKAMTTAPREISAEGFEKHVDISWPAVADEGIKYVKVYRSGDGKHFYPVGIQTPYINRYADFVDTTGRRYYYRISYLDHNYRESPLSRIANSKTFSMTDEQLLDMVQQAHMRYYWEGAEPASGLARENIHGRKNMIATGASGFGIMALIAGAERGFITKKDLSDRFETIVSFLERADRFHGAYPHFLDGTTGKVEAFFGDNDNGADLVETSFLAQGLLAAREYFKAGNDQQKAIANRIDSIWRKIEWSWFRKEADSDFLYWHWSPDKQWKINHKLIGWNETMITYFMSIASPTHGVPASMYYSGWASQKQEAQRYRSGWGQTEDGSMYTNGKTYYGIKLDVGVSNGGPLFFVHYSFLGLDPRKLKDRYTNYFENNKNIALINYRYCIDNPLNRKGYGPDAWGLTASDGPWQYRADEPVEHQDHGKITPTGALASFPYTPDKSMRALKNYYRNYGHFIWGEYGFRDAFNLDENWCSEIFMGLNQGPIVVMIENYRSRLLWKLFMQSAEAKAAINTIAEK